MAVRRKDLPDIIKKNKEKNPNGGRPKVNIDWERVDELLMYGCSGTEIAANIGIHNATLYDRCLTDKEISFSEYSQQKHEKGISLLKEHKFKKAIGKLEEGDTTLLIWMDKTWCKAEKDIMKMKNDMDIEKSKILLEYEMKLKNEGSEKLAPNLNEVNMGNQLMIAQATIESLKQEIYDIKSKTE